MMTVKRIALTLALACGVAGGAQAAATITIANTNAAGEGFNDPTPAAPIGGNAGTTLGQQRLIAFQHAANIWGATLTSSVPIRVAASFEALSCTADSAVLGSAGANDVYSDFPGAIKRGTWYPAALAAKLAGVDQTAPAAPHIVARFNSRLGLFADCMPGSGFYLGLDNKAGSQIDLVTVLLHELGHGLGFQTFTSGQTGEPMNGLPSVWDHYLLDNRSNKTWAEMSNTERAASAISGNGLSWAGAGVTAALPAALSPMSMLMVSGPAAGPAAGNYAVGDASFGPPLGMKPVAGQLAQVLDQGAATGLACTPLDAANQAAVRGNIALVDRGVCGFVDKAKVVQAAGAIGMVVADNEPAEVSGLGGSDPGVLIPAVRVSQVSGAKLKAALAGRPPGSSGVMASLGVNPAQLAGADGASRIRMYTPTEYSPGSTVSHYTTDARHNQLMEPAINGDLSHEVTAPADLTFSLLKDIGW